MTTTTQTTGYILQRNDGSTDGLGDRIVFRSEDEAQQAADDLDLEDAEIVEVDEAPTAYRCAGCEQLHNLPPASVASDTAEEFCARCTALAQREADQRSMTAERAEQIVRACAAQDRDGETGGRLPSTADTLAQWRRAGHDAGDNDVVEAIDRLGPTRAAQVYDSANPS